MALSESASPQKVSIVQEALFGETDSDLFSVARATTF